MEKALTITVGLCAIFALASCKKNKENKYDYKGKGTLRESIEYSNHYSLNNTILKASVKTDTMFDKNGNVVFEYVYYMPNDTLNWKLSYKTIYEYDKDGNKTLEEQLRASNVEGEFKKYRKVENVYENNKLKTETSYFVKNGYTDYSLEAVDTYTYDEFGNLSMTVKEYTDEYIKAMNNNTHNFKATYEYDSNNLLTEYSCFILEYTGWSPTTKYVYTYGENKKVKAEEFYYHNDIEYEKNGKLEYTYDEKDNVLEEIYYGVTSDKQSYELNRKYVNEYNSNGKVEKRQYYSFYENDYKFSREEKYEYNKKGEETYYGLYVMKEDKLTLYNKTLSTYTYYK